MTKVTATRLGNGPILRPFAERRMGGNLNGPSLIRVPNWVSGALGVYYLYFAHHQGRYIRLAYADALDGPWTVHPPGVLDIAETPQLMDHIASPDVHVDEARRELRMYLHGVSSPEPFEEPTQSTILAQSSDGLSFACQPDLLGPSYFRVWAYRGAVYALSLAGMLWRADRPEGPFAPGPRLMGLPETTRHPAVLVEGDIAWVAWTAVGDRPERILIGRVDLAAADWTAWQIEKAQELLRPEHPWEGAHLPCEPSRPGIATEPANQLRDPAFFTEDGQTYLIYAAAAESGLALARLEFDASERGDRL